MAFSYQPQGGMQRQALLSQMGGPTQRQPGGFQQQQPGGFMRGPQQRPTLPGQADSRALQAVQQAYNAPQAKPQTPPLPPQLPPQADPQALQRMQLLSMLGGG
jgi:hypothetical protein